MITLPKTRLHTDALSSGFTAIGGGYHSENIFVPVAREKELATYLQEYRNAALNASDKDDVTEESTPELPGSLVAKPELEAMSQAKVQDDLDKTVQERICQRVPCIYEEDVRAQQKSVEGYMRFADRDRNNAVKAVTKALLARPMTRKIGMPPDVDMAMSQLAAVAPHIPELIEALRIPLLVAAATGAPPMLSPILLVGGAGVGKSHVALQIASIFGVPAHTVSYAASGAAGNVLSGADKNWGNSATGIVFNALAEGEFANPVIVLDEVDKAGVTSATQGPDRNPLNELLALLEPVTAREHKDRCAEIRVDARHVVWIATANSLEGLSAPLLSRFKLILINKPNARAAVTIAWSVTQAASLQMGVTVKPPSGEVLQLLATLTPRTMRRVWTGAAGWATVGGRDQVTIQDVEQSLGLGVAPQNRLH